MEVKEYIRNQEPIFLSKAKDGKTWICPECGSGTGKNGTGITRNPKKPTQYKCWSCGFSGDVIDLYGLYAGIENNAEKFQGVYDYFGVEGNKSIQKETPKPHPDQSEKLEELKDYTKFLEKAKANNNFEYLEKRGISREVQELFNIGFISDWISQKAIETTKERGGNPDNIPTSPRCIIPRDKTNYLARDTRENLTEKEKAYKKQNQGSTTLFNLKGLDSKVVFITEGEIDAMSIHEAGGIACGLCSTSNYEKVLKYLEDNNKGQKLILMLDNDKAGYKTMENLSKGLEALEVPYTVAKYEYSDPNEFLINDREGLKKLVSSLQVEALEPLDSQQNNKYNASSMLDYFLNIEDQPEGLEVKTGFNCFDREDRNFYGGIHEGLYIIGAISSLGKTTFCLQLANQISGNGQDVIFFSLEQSKLELIAKGISYHTYKKYGDKKDSLGHYKARETNQVLNNRRYKFYTPEEKKIIKDAIESYSEQAKHLYIYEGRYKDARMTTEHIDEIIKNHIETTGRMPIVFVDYLQILGTPDNFRGTDKQATDIAVTELKEISRKHKTAVIAISSFNRENYNNSVTMASFKESGAIEYSSDVLLGLQFKGMTRDPEGTQTDYTKRIEKLKAEIETKKAYKEPIEIELKCLKNRNGNNFTATFNFINAFNFYEEDITIPQSFRVSSEQLPFDEIEEII